MPFLFLFVVSNSVSLRRFLILIPRPTVTINNVVVLAFHLHSEAKELMLVCVANLSHLTTGFFFWSLWPQRRACYKFETSFTYHSLFWRVCYIPGVLHLLFLSIPGVTLHFFSSCHTLDLQDKVVISVLLVHIFVCFTFYLLCHCYSIVFGTPEAPQFSLGLTN